MIRPMTTGDVDAVMAVERRSEGAPHWDREAYLACVPGDEKSPIRRFGLVAHEGENLAGFAVLRAVTFPDDVEAELESIAVDAEFRGRGIGAGLIEAAIDLARQMGVGRLDLEVRASNLAAIRLYRRAGLAETGRRRGYYSQPDDDAVLMQVTL
jgi:ribosomal-protein-alanine N-acetyltransferase